MDVNRIRNTVIFKGMSEAEIADALAGLNAMTKKYKKGLAILHAGSVTNRMGLVLEGSVTIENNDVWGNKTILTHVGKDHFFAETYGLLADEPLLVDVVANEDCHILFLSIGNLHRGGLKADTLVFAGEEHKVDGVFIIKDTVSVTKLVPGLVYENGAVAVDRRMATSVPGVFAAGDCTGKPFQLAKAVGEGNVAALSAVDYIAALKK